MAGTKQHQVPGVRERAKLHTRQRLLGAAKDLFEERGYDNVTIAEIAARAQVSAKTLFQHFRSKEDLLIGELDEVHQDLIRALGRRDLSKTPLEAVTDWLIQWPAQRPPDAFERFVRLVGGGPSVESVRRRLYDEWENAIVVVLADEANEARPTPRTRLIAAQLIALIRVLTSPEQRAFIERYPPQGRQQAYREAVLDAAAQLARGLGREAARSG
jgi:AcrR family transcriptional regulator